MSEAASRSSDLREAFERLAPSLDGRGDEIEALGRLPDDLVDALMDLGIFRAFVPARVGGLEYDYPQFLRIAERAAQADASIAWCIAQGAIISSTTAWLPEATARKIWSDPRACIANGPPSGARAVTEGEGFRLNGRWPFSSGCMHATWMSCVASTGDRGIVLFIPKAQADILGNWDTKGLVGTASHDFEVRDVWVPTAQALDPKRCLSDHPFYAVPTTLAFANAFACVALGIAHSALEFSKALSTGKLPRFQDEKLSRQPHAQEKIGRAATLLHAARTFLFANVDAVWDGVVRRGAIEASERVALRMSGTHVIREAAKIVDIAYDVAGTDAIHPDRSIHRRFLDMHVITQHMQGRSSNYEHIGRYELGLGIAAGPVF